MRTISRSFAALIIPLIVSTFLIVHPAPAAAADDSDTLMPESSSQMSINQSRAIKVTLVTLDTPDTTAAQTAAINMSTAKNAITYANKYWHTLSNKRLSISLTKTIKGFKTKAKTSDNGNSIIEKVKSELKWNPPSNSVLVIFMPRNDIIVNGRVGYQGLGGVTGDASGQVLMPYTTAMTNHDFTHEMGHVFGMRHGNSLYCKNGATDARATSLNLALSSCSSMEYGDTSDIMGTPKLTTQYLNSVLFDYAGMGAGNEIRNIGYPDGVKSYTLKPWAGTGANRAVKFTDPISKEVYYIQLRIPVGYDKSNAIGADQGVQILKADVHDGGSLLLPPRTLPRRSAWGAGSTFTTATGFKIKINYISMKGAGVTITGGSLYKLAPTMDTTAKKHDLGAPVGSVVGYLKDGMSYRKYARGYVYYSPKTGTVITRGVINAAYVRLGLNDSTLGYPKTNEISGLKNGGVYQKYQGGRMFWSPKTGAHPVTGVIGKKWDEVGAQNGKLGYPVSGLTTDNIESITQKFQRGQIVWTAKSGATVLLDTTPRKMASSY